MDCHGGALSTSCVCRVCVLRVTVLQSLLLIQCWNFFVLKLSLLTFCNNVTIHNPPTVQVHIEGYNVLTVIDFPAIVNLTECLFTRLVPITCYCHRSSGVSVFSFGTWALNLALAGCLACLSVYHPFAAPLVREQAVTVSHAYCPCASSSNLTIPCAPHAPYFA